MEKRKRLEKYKEVGKLNLNSEEFRRSKSVRCGSHWGRSLQDGLGVVWTC